MGLGYVGLPLALTFVERGGLRVTGFDVDRNKVEALERGDSYIMYLGSDRIRRARDAGRFTVTSDMTRLGEPDALLIAVPTPLTSQRTPEMCFVIDTTRQVQRALRRGQLVVLESTTYPGTTDELVRGILEESRLVCGVDFLLAFSPEREDPGNRDFSTATIPKIVGGVDAASADVACALYARAARRAHRRGRRPGRGHGPRRAAPCSLALSTARAGALGRGHRMGGPVGARRALVGSARIAAASGISSWSVMSCASWWWKEAAPGSKRSSTETTAKRPEGAERGVDQ